MKKALLAIAAFAALLCGCDKYGDRLDEIESRISALEQTCMDINANISTIQKIVDAQAAGISIKSVEKVDNGFQITFSDGTSYYIVNGPKGDSPAIQAVKDAADGKFYWKVNDEWLRTEDGAKVPVTGATPQLKIEDGEWFVSIDGGTTWEKLGVAKGGTDITFTEDDTAYYFDFGDGNVAKIAKMAAFILKVETDAVEVAAGKSVAVPYTIVGADATTHVVAEAQGYTAKVDESAKTVTITAGSSVEAGYVIVKAIRNSDGASTSQFISVNDSSSPAPTGSLSISISEVIYNAVSFTVTPSSNDFRYIVNCWDKASIEEYGLTTDEALFEDELGTFEYLAMMYGYTLEQIIDILSTTGPVTETIDELDPDTEYVLYAYGVSSDLTLSTPIARVEFTTPSSPSGDSAYEAMLGTWTAKGQFENDAEELEDGEWTLTFREKEKNKSFTITGFYEDFEAVANFDETKKILEIPFGANNIIAKFNFGSIGTQYGCWMGYDGEYVYTKGSFYWKLNDDMSLSSATTSSGELIDPLGIVGGVYTLNNDGTCGDWMKYTFTEPRLFTSITKNPSKSSVDSKRAPKKIVASDKLVVKNVTAHKCMLEVK